MTVIAAFAVDGVPLVFSDLLLTGPQLGPAPAKAVPAIRNVEDVFGDSGWNVSGLRQKITLISPNCAIAWAGSYAAARMALGELRRMASGRKLSHLDILDYLSREPDLKRHPVSFVGFMVESDLIHQFHFGAHELDSPTLGKVYIGGSGAKAIHDFSELLRTMTWKQTGSKHPAMSAVSRALTLGGLLLQLEFRGGSSAETILNMFGGGYEIAVFADGRFRKVDSVTYAFWEAQATDSDVLLSPPQLIVKQRYLHEHLLIRAVHLKTGATDRPIELSDDQRHSISPMVAGTPEPALADLKDFSLESRLFNHCILLHQGRNPLGVYTLVRNYERLEDAELVIEDRDDQVLLKVRPELLRMIGQSLRSVANASG